MNAAVPNTDEAELVAKAADGCTDAFTELFNRYYPMIHDFAYRLSLCPGEAADISQDTFIQAARAIRGFRHEASFKNWLYAIAANKGRDRHRNRDRRERLGREWIYLQESAERETEPAGAAIVREALTNLPVELREAVTLVYYEGMSHADAARVLDCAETTVSWRIFRAKKKLKILLKREGAPGVWP